MEARSARRSLAVLVALVGLACAAGPTEALVPVLKPVVELDYRLPDSPLDPLFEAAGDSSLFVPFRVTYTVPEPAYSPQPTVIEVQVTEIPPWLTARPEPDRFEVAMDRDLAQGGPSPERTFILAGALALSSAAGVPALSDGVLLVRAVARENGAIAAASDEEQGLVRVTYSARIDAVADPFAITPDAGETEVVPIVVTNLGNARVLVNATVESAPRGVSARVNATERHLEHAGAPGRGDTTVLALEVTRATRADVGEVVVQVTSRFAIGGAAAESRLVRVYVGEVEHAAARGAGGVGWVPALAFLATAAIVAGVLVRR